MTQEQHQKQILHIVKDGQECAQFHGGLQDFFLWLNEHKELAPSFDGATLQRELLTQEHAARAEQP